MPESESATENKPFHAKNLLSTHFLNVHLRSWDEWLETEKAENAFQCIRRVYEKHKDELPTCNEYQLEDKLIKPVLKCLDHHFEVQALALSGRPDYAFFADEESAKEAVRRQKQDDFYLKAIAVGDAKVWEEPLDRFRGGRPVHERSNPSYQIDTYLRATPPRWAILTNGRYWRLYCEDTSYRGDSYYEVDLVRLIEGEDLDDFKYFYLFFRRQAFERDGESFLGRVFSESANYAKALGKSLKENVYQAMRTIAVGFLDWTENRLLKGDAEIEVIRENTMRLLYRLLFILYAESRSLLDLSHREYARMSLQTIKREVADLIDKRESMSKLQTTYWDRLDNLFRLINMGSEALEFDPDILYVPPYNGDLFDPNKSIFLRDKKVSDFYLAPAIDLLARSVEDNGRKSMIDYSTLDIRHLGSIYEGLLEFRLAIAKDDIVAIKIKGKEKWQKKTGPVKGAIEEVKAGELYLTTDKRERRITGSYYTPEYVVKYIVENALQPVVKKALGTTKGMKSKAILSIKVLDPAMGSGHFLVEAVDFLARHLSDAVEMDIDNKLLAEGDYSADWAKREIAAHCIYGVDKNPMAVELAKVSLWLKTVSGDKPLSFLDHRLRCGDSLIGVRLEDLPTYPKQKKKEKVPDKSVKRFEVDVRKPFVGELLKRINKLESLREDTVADVKRKEELFEGLKQSKEYKRIKAFADVYAAVFFDNPTGKDYYNNLLWALGGGDLEWKEKTSGTRFRKAIQCATRNRFFHWQLEFPEIFYGSDRIKNPGFDAVVGNPPYGAEISAYERSYIESHFETATTDSAAYFLELCQKLSSGYYGMIVPKSIAFYNGWQSIRNVILDRDSVLFLLDPGLAFEDVNYEQIVLVNSKMKEERKTLIHIAFPLKKPIMKKQIIPDGQVKSDLMRIANVLIFRGINAEEERIIRKLKKVSVPLESIREDIYRGLYIPDKDKAALPSGDYSFVNRVPDVQRYFIEKTSRIDIAQNDKWVKKAKRVMVPRIFMKVLRGSRLVGFFDPGHLLTTEKLVNIRIREDSGYSYLYLLALINSPVISYYIQRVLFSKTTETSRVMDDPYAKIFPIRQVWFTTPKDRRTTLLDQAIGLYRDGLESKDLDTLVGFAEDRLPKDEEENFIREEEESDVVHDLLAYLAEQMLEMGKSRRDVIGSFLVWLEREIGTEIESLAGKTKLKRFYELDFNDFLKLLKKNEKRIQKYLGNKELQENLEKQFEESRRILLPLADRIGNTDTAIDRIVFRLYGLNDSEIDTLVSTE